MNVLEIKSLSKTYKDKVIYDDVDLSIKKVDDIITIWGESGSGKSTLLNMILGYDQNYSGDVVVFGKNIKNMNAQEYVSYLQKDVSIVYQELKLFENLNIYDNLKYVVNDIDIINKYLDYLGMKKFAKKKVKHLSGGQKQRVAIIRALIKKPKLLILDEPTSALDNNTFEELMVVLNKIKYDTQILIVTHDYRFKKYSNHIYEIEGNTIVRKNNEIKGQELNVKKEVDKKDKEQEEEEKYFRKLNIFKSTLNIIKTQKFNYVNKLLLSMIFINIFLLLFSLTYVRLKEEAGNFYYGLEDNGIMLSFENVDPSYEYNGESFVIPQDQMFWSEKDVEKLKNIEGVEDVYLMNEDNVKYTDKDGYDLVEGFNSSNLPEVLKDKPSSVMTVGVNFHFASLTEPKGAIPYYKTSMIYNLDLIVGDYPNDNSNQILIPDFMAEQMIMDNDSFAKYEDVLNEKVELETVNEEFLKKEKEYEIVGVYKTDYANVLDDYYIYTGFSDNSYTAEDFSYLYKNKDNLEVFTKNQQEYFSLISKNEETLKKALGTGYNDIVLELDENANQKEVYEDIKSIYPNHVQRSKYSYKINPEIKQFKMNMIEIISTIIFIFVLIICVLLFVLQRSYYRNKVKEYTILLSLGYSKLKLAMMLSIEGLIDLVLIFVSVIIIGQVLKNLAYTQMNTYAKLILDPVFILITLFIVVVIVLVNILYLLIHIKYKKLVEFLK